MGVGGACLDFAVGVIAQVLKLLKEKANENDERTVLMWTRIGKSMSGRVSECAHNAGIHVAVVFALSLIGKLGCQGAAHSEDSVYKTATYDLPICDPTHTAKSL